MTTQNLQIDGPYPERSARIGLTSLMLLASVSLLAGCGGMVNDAPSASTIAAGLQGNVHGGQSPGRAPSYSFTPQGQPVMARPRRHC